MVPPSCDPMHAYQPTLGEVPGNDQSLEALQMQQPLQSESYMQTDCFNAQSLSVTPSSAYFPCHDSQMYQVQELSDSQQVPIHSQYPFNSNVNDQFSSGPGGEGDWPTKPCVFRQSCLNNVGLGLDTNSCSPALSRILFAQWAAENIASFQRPSESEVYYCPLHKCKQILYHREEYLVHVLQCPKLKKGKYQCCFHDGNVEQFYESNSGLKPPTKAVTSSIQAVIDQLCCLGMVKEVFERLLPDIISRLCQVPPEEFSNKYHSEVPPSEVLGDPSVSFKMSSRTSDGLNGTQFPALNNGSDLAFESFGNENHSNSLSFDPYYVSARTQSPAGVFEPAMTASFSQGPKYSAYAEPNTLQGVPWPPLSHKFCDSWCKTPVSKPCVPKYVRKKPSPLFTKLDLPMQNLHGGSLGVATPWNELNSPLSIRTVASETETLLPGTPATSKSFIDEHHLCLNSRSSKQEPDKSRLLPSHPIEALSTISDSLLRRFVEVNKSYLESEPEADWFLKSTTCHERLLVKGLEVLKNRKLYYNPQTALENHCFIHTTLSMALAWELSYAKATLASIYDDLGLWAQLSGFLLIETTRAVGSLSAAISLTPDRRVVALAPRGLRKAVTYFASEKSLEGVDLGKNDFSLCCRHYSISSSCDRFLETLKLLGAANSMSLMTTPLGIIQTTSNMSLILHHDQSNRIKLLERLHSDYEFTDYLPSIKALMPDTCVSGSFSTLRDLELQLFAESARISKNLQSHVKFVKAIRQMCIGLDGERHKEKVRTDISDGIDQILSYLVPKVNSMIKSQQNPLPIIDQSPDGTFSVETTQHSLDSSPATLPSSEYSPSSTHLDSTGHRTNNVTRQHKKGKKRVSFTDSGRYHKLGCAVPGCKQTFKGKAKNAKANLNRHLREIHFPDQPKPKCLICDKTFSRTSNLNQHKREKHP